jgi:hypothetical protein
MGILGGGRGDAAEIEPNGAIEMARRKTAGKGAGATLKTR